MQLEENIQSMVVEVSTRGFVNVQEEDLTTQGARKTSEVTVKLYPEEPLGVL